MFSEVPNHSREFLIKRFGGRFHLSFPTAYGFHTMMRNSGFTLLEASTYGRDDQAAVMARGWHLRSIFFKDPARRDFNEQLELDTTPRLDDGA